MRKAFSVDCAELRIGAAPPRIDQKLVCDHSKHEKSSLIAASFVAMAAVVIVIAQTRRAQSVAGSATGSDRKVYAEGPAPALPRAGGTFLDPAFGSTIMRLTDEVDGTACVNFYSYWPSFNLDSTRLIIRCDADAKLYRFDPNRFQIVGKGQLFERPAAGTFQSRTRYGAAPARRFFTATPSRGFSLTT